MKPKAKTILFILLSFILGIILGWFLEERVFTMKPNSENRGPGDFHKVLAERLHLNDHQIAQVDSILGIHKQRMDEFRKQALAIRDTMRIEIRKILNAGQTKLFDEFIQEMNNREAKKHDHEPVKK